MVIILSYAVGSMAKQLLKMGVSPERIVLGPQLKPYNTFEDMLFIHGDGKLILEGNDVVYSNERYKIREITDDDNLEKLIGVLKKTNIYYSSENCWIILS